MSWEERFANSVIQITQQDERLLISLRLSCVME